MVYSQKNDPNYIAQCIREAYNVHEARSRKTSGWRCPNSERAIKMFRTAAENCIALGSDPHTWVEYAYDWMGDKRVFPETLASPKYVTWLQTGDALKHEDYNQILRDLGMDIPDGAPPVDEHQYELLVGVQTFFEWLERNHGVRHITDEIIDRSLTRSYMDLDPLIVYVCGCYKTRVRELFGGRARQRLDECPELKKAMRELGWQPMGLDI